MVDGKCSSNWRSGVDERGQTVAREDFFGVLVWNEDRISMFEFIYGISSSEIVIRMKSNDEMMINDPIDNFL